MQQTNDDFIWKIICEPAEEAKEKFQKGSKKPRVYVKNFFNQDSILDTRSKEEPTPDEWYVLINSKTGKRIIQYDNNASRVGAWPSLASCGGSIKQNTDHCLISFGHWKRITKGDWETSIFAEDPDNEKYTIAMRTDASADFIDKLFKEQEEKIKQLQHSLNSYTSAYKEQTQTISEIVKERNSYRSQTEELARQLEEKNLQAQKFKSSANWYDNLIEQIKDLKDKNIALNEQVEDYKGTSMYVHDQFEKAEDELKLVKADFKKLKISQSSWQLAYYDLKTKMNDLLKSHNKTSF